MFNIRARLLLMMSVLASIHLETSRAETSSYLDSPGVQFDATWSSRLPGAVGFDGSYPSSRLID